MVAALSERVGQISPLSLPRWQKQAAIRRQQHVRDQVGERICVSVSIEYVLETRFGSALGGCRADSENRAVMQAGGASSDGILAGQKSGGDMMGCMNILGDDGQDWRYDGRKTERREAGGGFGGAGLWPGNQNALQGVALVKEAPVDDVWREVDTPYPTPGRVPGKTDDGVPCLARTSAGKV